MLSFICRFAVLLCQRIMFLEQYIIMNTVQSLQPSMLDVRFFWVFHTNRLQIACKISQQYYTCLTSKLRIGIPSISSILWRLCRLFSIIHEKLCQILCQETEIYFNNNKQYLLLAFTTLIQTLTRSSVAFQQNLTFSVLKKTCLISVFQFFFILEIFFLFSYYYDMTSFREQKVEMPFRKSEK